MKLQNLGIMSRLHAQLNQSWRNSRPSWRLVDLRAVANLACPKFLVSHASKETSWPHSQFVVKLIHHGVARGALSQCWAKLGSLGLLLRPLIPLLGTRPKIHTHHKNIFLNIESSTWLTKLIQTRTSTTIHHINT